MIQWIEAKGGKQYWCQQFPRDEMKLLKRYHITIGRMTKLDYSRIIK
tara:strand:+ start:1608 stop:1748 length:141 start_codon:yes stop_codon:yes gene_type:complete